MLAAVDCDVLRLRRVRIGSLLLGDLNVGEYRHLQARESHALRAAVGLEN